MLKAFFDILAGRYKSGTATIEVQPGAESPAYSRLYLEEDTSKYIYLDQINGSDANTGFSSVQAKQSMAGAAAAIGGGRTTVHVINDGAVIDTPVNVPVQMARTLFGKISMNSTHRRYGTAALATFGSTKPVLFMNPKTGRIAVAQAGSPTQSSTDGGTTWGNNVANGGVTGLTPFMPDYIEALDGFLLSIIPSGYTIYSTHAAPVFTSLPAPALPDSGNWGISYCNYSPTLGQYIGCKYSALPNYLAVSQNYPSVALWKKYDSAFLDTAEFNSGNFPVAFFDIGTHLVTYITNGTTGNIYTKAKGASDFTLLAAFGGGTLTRSKKVKDGCFFITNENDSYLFINGTAISIPFATDATYDKNTDQIFVVGDGSNIQVRSPIDGTVLYTWNSISARTFSVLAAPGGLLVVEFNGTFFNYNMRRFQIVSPKITANVAGFTIGDGDLSSAVTKVLSCTKPYIEGLFTRVQQNKTEELIVTNDTLVVSENLIRKSAQITSDPANPNDLDVFSNTIPGTFKLVNNSETYNERFYDNYFGGGFNADFNVLLHGGAVNPVKELTNATLDNVFQEEPAFEDTIDYKPQREINGYAQDSILVAASLVYTNSIAAARDLGAWSFREENVTYKFRKHFKIWKPTGKDAVKYQKHLLTSANPTAGGKPSVVNIPSAAWEEVFLQYGSLPTSENKDYEDQFKFIEFMQQEESMDVQISWNGKDEVISAVTIDGEVDPGDVFVTVLEDDVLPGTKFRWFGVLYTVIRVSGYRLILDKDILDTIPDTTALALESPVLYGDYRFIPEKDPTLSLNHFAQTDYKRGMTLRFGRKCVSQS